MGSNCGALLVFASLIACLQAADPIGSQKCATCHAEIAQDYGRTPMAQTSGSIREAVASFPPGRQSFLHMASGYKFVVTPEPLLISYSRNTLKGEIRPDYFIGSGHVGRSFVFSKSNYLFMSPVSFYAAEQRWDLSPGYQNYTDLYLTRPITEECWTCHASGVRRQEGTINGYTTPPFREGGVSCERCHGPGSQHAAKGDSSAIVNPAKLVPGRRDDVCAQCHLTGEQRIAKPGKRLSNFQPGEELSAFVAIFAGREARATDHFESFAESACARGSKGKMWCGSCHSVHKPPPAVSKDAFYREKCLACHRPGDCGEEAQTRALAQNNCVTCHMPKRTVRDVLHAAYTDHRIQLKQPKSSVGNGRPVPVSAGTTVRDQALALAVVALERNDPVLEAESYQLLSGMESKFSGDALALAVLGRLFDIKDDRAKAVTLYRKAISLDPLQIEAEVNLGALLFENGDWQAAIALWRQVTLAQPGLEAARLNLAKAFAKEEKVADARKELQTLLEFSPDNSAALLQLLDLVRSP